MAGNASPAGVALLNPNPAKRRRRDDPPRLFAPHGRPAPASRRAFDLRERGWRRGTRRGRALIRPAGGWRAIVIRSSCTCACVGNLPARIRRSEHLSRNDSTKHNSICPWEDFASMKMRPPDVPKPCMPQPLPASGSRVDRSKAFLPNRNLAGLLDTRRDWHALTRRRRQLNGKPCALSPGMHTLQLARLVLPPNCR